MAKKKQENSGPEVSSLPIKHDDSPLVIDLPDGQKLVVGHLANGSVIEVATWRGTGRPDSRTSRLMLGMSSAAGAAEQAAAEEAKKTSEKKSLIAPIVSALTTFASNFKAKKISRKDSATKSEVSKEESVPFVQAVTPAVQTQSDDVQDWLNSIIAKSEKKATRTKPAPSKKAPAKKAVRKAAPKSAKGRTR